LVLPAWLAVKVQLPAETRVSALPLTVQIDAVDEAIVTAEPEAPPVAESAGAAVPMVWLPGDAKVIA
jgi:hypothetical protein